MRCPPCPDQTRSQSPPHRAIIPAPLPPGISSRFDALLIPRLSRHIFKWIKQFYTRIGVQERDDRATATIRNLPDLVAPAHWEPCNG